MATHFDLAARALAAGKHVLVEKPMTATAAQARALIDLAVRESAGGRILTEGGPTLFGQFLQDGVIYELFLPIAPRLAGRSRDKRRLALVEGTAFTPSGSPRGKLLSLKLVDEYLFARYALRDRGARGEG